jgi:hypothetical protein
MIRKLKSGEYRLYSKSKNEDGKHKVQGTFISRHAAEIREREVRHFARVADPKTRGKGEKAP